MFWSLEYNNLPLHEISLEILKTTEKMMKIRKAKIEDEKSLILIIEKKRKTEEPVTKKRKIKDIVFRQFYKYLKIFRKKKLEKILTGSYKTMLLISNLALYQRR